MGDTATQPCVGRSRSFGGCATCRSRHTKCDEARPSCEVCRSAGLPCGGYEKNIFFDFEGAPEAGSLRFRRPLLTEKERKVMSEWLISAVPYRLVDRKLSRIDEACDEASEKEAIEISHGPFGAFRAVPLPRSPPTQDSPTSSLIGSVEHPQVTPPDYDGLVYQADSTFSPETQQWIQTIFDLPFQEPSSDLLDMPDIMLSDGRIEEIFEDSLMSGIGPASFTHDVQPIHFPVFSSELPATPLPGCIPGSIVTAAGNTVPQDAVLLLKHYQTTVLRLLTPFRHSKTPWHVLFIPHAKNCLAALTLGESVDHAGLCLFYGILAVSAFSMSGLSPASTSLEQARKYKQHAREHAKRMLQTSYKVPKAAKYKSILMALLTMVQVSMTTGNHDQTECYFLEAEKFIRLRGLNRKKSRKVRLLHHCYAFERILHESTSIDSHNSSHRLHVREAVETSGLSIYGQDSASFRLGKWNNLAEDMKRVKGQDEGENDLHLEHPGIWAATLYPEIFGVPETWLFLVSLIIRLARQKEDVEQGVGSEPLSAKDFLGRARAIERCINQIRKPSPNLDHYDDPAVTNMLDAMQNALAIYFYRNIYDVESALLQHKVEMVRDCLLRCSSSDPEVVYGSARLIWPVVVAASEAVDPNVQASFRGWLRTAAQKSGLRLFSDTLEDLERKWQEKGVSCNESNPFIHPAIPR